MTVDSLVLWLVLWLVLSPQVFGRLEVIPLSGKKAIFSIVKMVDFCIVEVNQIISLLPNKLLSELAADINVNKYAKKLHAELMFKLLLHSILSYKGNSLRTMASAYESTGFALLNAGKKSDRIGYSSISERLSTMNPLYFERLYQKCLQTYKSYLPDKTDSLIRFDSTIVALSGKLLKVGYHLQAGDAAHLRQLKFTIGLSNLPIAVHFFNDQTHNSENVALKEAILALEPENTEKIRVFDRGITARKTYDEFIEKNIPFVSRINIKSKRQSVSDNQVLQPIDTDTLSIYSDSWVYLFSERARAKYPLRCIESTRKETNEHLVFITNIKNLPAQDITLLYKRRWDIEVFFKFLKQELNFAHLINRSENGIKIMLYCTLIASILLLVYKEMNHLKGYKIMKQRFVDNLEKCLLKDFVQMCGGDPDLVEINLKSPPS